MLQKEQMYGYQARTSDFIVDKKFAALFLDMGLGKTVITATAISRLLDNFDVTKVLVIAPKNVARYVWAQEFKQWAHLQGYSVRVCWGTPVERRQAVLANTDILVVNRENVLWLTDHFRWKWDMLVIDESTSFKSPRAKKFKRIKKYLKHVKSSVILTGTPAAQSYMDIWGQMFLVDRGQRLGRTLTNFRQKYFKPAGFKGYGWALRDELQEDRIKDRIKDIAISMRSEDYLELPPLLIQDMKVELSPSARVKYDTMAKEAMIELDNELITAATAGVVMNKLLQIANGTIYRAEEVWDEARDDVKTLRHLHDVHSDKIDALKDIVEDNPSENFLVAYSFQSDLAKLQAAFPNAVVMNKTKDAIKQWNKGEIRMMLTHPASAGHGLNLQFGGNIAVWFGLNWSLELYLQFNKRLHRKGQLKPVRIIRLIAAGTADVKVAQALSDNEATQESLLKFIRGESLQYLEEAL